MDDHTKWIYFLFKHEERKEIKNPHQAMQSACKRKDKMLCYHAQTHRLRLTSGGCMVTSWASTPSMEHSGLRKVKRAARAATLAASIRFLNEIPRVGQWFKPRSSVAECWHFTAYPPLSRI